jgi:probable HAF family extracellular repeat protein
VKPAEKDFLRKSPEKILGHYDSDKEIPNRLYFTPSDIIWADTQRRLKRKISGSPSDLRDLFFVLRVLGDYLDRKKPGQFTISWSKDSLMIRVNNRGQIVGWSQDSTGAVYSFLYDGVVLTPLNFPGSLGTVVFGINDRAQVVGWYVDSNNLDRGFLYDDGVFISLDVPGTTFTSARGINNRGQIVGWYSDSNFATHGFLYDKEVFTTLDVPGALKVFS